MNALESLKAKVTAPSASAPPKKESTLDNIKISIPGVNKQPEDEPPQCVKSLSYRQRMFGFGICFVLGYLTSMLAIFSLTGGGSVAAFAVFYVFGQFIALAGSGFLVGPARQCKTMFHPDRRVAAGIYLAMLILILAVAFVEPDLGIIILVLCGVQIVAAIWYSASYVPYGRKMLANISKKVCGISS